MRFRSIISAFIFFLLCLPMIKTSAELQPVAPDNTANPFLSESTLPFHAPPFDKIKDDDYAPAMETGMKDQLAEIDVIANDRAAPTFAA